jgi:hypothetical protein
VDGNSAAHINAAAKYGIEFFVTENFLLLDYCI